MKNLTLLLFSVFCISFTQAQKKNETTKVVVNQKSMVAIEKFEQDLQKNHFDLYVMSRLLPEYNKYEAEFQEKYKINYIKMGCVVTENLNECEKYNKLVFAYLNKKHGTAWRKMVLEQTLGI